jgi:hypothetical protein
MTWSFPMVVRNAFQWAHGKIIFNIGKGAHVTILASR